MIRIMKKLIRNWVVMGAMSTMAMSPAIAEDQAEQELSPGEAELAELLEGRVAGEPVRCLRQSQHRGVRIIDDTAMVFRSGRTVFVFTLSILAPGRNGFFGMYEIKSRIDFTPLKTFN